MDHVGRQVAVTTGVGLGEVIDEPAPAAAEHLVEPVPVLYTGQYKIDREKRWACLAMPCGRIV